jgi:hypothetical protein
VTGSVAARRPGSASPASVRGAEAIGRFFRETPCGGDIGRLSVVATRANGRPAIAMHERVDAGRLVPHGVLLLEISGDEIAGIDAFIDPALPGLFAPPLPRARPARR